jgi:hypothetical protein
LSFRTVFAERSQSALAKLARTRATEAIRAWLTE